MLNVVAVANFDGRPANRVAQETSGSWGVLFFAFFLMDKHKKEWSPRGEKVSDHPQNSANTRTNLVHSKLTTSLQTPLFFELRLIASCHSLCKSV
jgi:hypothetical protein